MKRSDRSNTVRHDSVRGPLDSTILLALIGSVFVFGQLTDLLGTYVAQPHFEHEGNWLFMGLKSVGIHLGWKSAILGKSLLCALGIACLDFFAAQRRRFYPPFRMSGSALVHWFVYGRLPNAPASSVSDSRDIRALLVLFAGFWAMSGPIYLYMGYDNLAAHYGWFRFAGFYIGGLYTTWGDFIFMLSTLGGLLFLLEADHQTLVKVSADPKATHRTQRLLLRGSSS